MEATCLCSPVIQIRSGVTFVSSAGSRDSAVLLYRYTGENEVDLMSTFVPEAFRGRGVAALLSQVTSNRNRSNHPGGNDRSSRFRPPSTSWLKRSSELRFPVGT